MSFIATVNFVFNRREGVRTLDSLKLDSAHSGEKYEKETLKIAGTTLEERNKMGAKTIESNICEKKDESKDIKKSSISLVQAEKGMKKYSRKSCDLDDAPSKRAKIDGSGSNSVQGLSAPRNDDAAHLSTGATTSKGKLKSGLVKDSAGCRKDVKLAENSSPLDEKLSKTGVSLSKEASRSGHAEAVAGLQKNSKANGDSNALSKPKALSSPEKENLGSAHRKDSLVAEKDKKLGGNLSSCGEKSSETNVVSRVETQKPSTTNVLPNQTPKSVPNKEIEGSGQSGKPIQSLSTSMKNPVGISAQESKEKSNLGQDQSLEKKEVYGQSEKPSRSLSPSMKMPVEISNLGRDKLCENKEGSAQAAKPLQSSSTSLKRTLEISVEESNIGHDKSLEKEQKLAGNSCPEDERYLKKAKLDNSIKRLDVNKNNKIKNMKENSSLGETKNSPKCPTSSENNVKSRLDERPSEYRNAKAKINVGETKLSPKSGTRDNKAKSRLGEGPSKVHHNEKDGKLLNDNLPNPLSSKSKDDVGKVGGKIIEVTPRPPVS